MTAKKTKHIGIECCRILAMLMICNLHVLGMGGILEKVDSQKDFYYIFANFLEAFSYSAVNIYILISGYVGLYSQFSYKKIFLKVRTPSYLERGRKLKKENNGCGLLGKTPHSPREGTETVVY